MMSLSRYDITNNQDRPALTDIDINRAWAAANGKFASATHHGSLDFVDYAYTVHHLPSNGRAPRVKVGAQPVRTPVMQSPLHERNQSLDPTLGQLGPAGERVLPGVDVQGSRLATGEEQLEDVVRLLEEFSVDGSDRTSEESHSWKDGSSEMKQRRDDHRSQLEAELLRVTDLSEDVFSNMETEYARQMASAKDTISNIQHALSKMTQTINHLHLSFSSTSRDADDLSKIIEGQAARILLLQNLVSDLRECNKPPLERRLKDQVSQIKLVAEWTGRARVDDQKRERPGQQLSEDLKSLQQELDASSAQAKAYARSVSGLSNEVSDLQGQCRSCEQRVDGLRRELDKAIALTRDFERRGRKMMRDDAQREQVALMDEWKKLRHQLGNMRRMDKDKVAVIRRQLERPHRISKYRNDRIQHLVKETRTQLLDCLDHLQASVRERGLKIGYLEWKSSGIEGQTDQLESRLGDLDLALDNHKWGAFKFCEVTLVTGHIRRLHDQAADIELAFERALY